MKTERTTPPFSRLVAALAALAALVATPSAADAQYFGRNKVQYDDFEFRVLSTDHFDIHFYDEEERAIDDIARMSERWYERFARAFQHEFERKKPLIMYADHPDFQQTNTLRGALGEGTGGVTESLKNRVIMPMTGSYADTDHVLGHELVHAFQYNIAQSRRGGGIQGLSTLPLWLIEGMAEYMSVGREDPHTAMWLRDAIRRDEFPTIEEMTKEARFFPYRFGQALWAYIGGTYGDEAVTQIFRRSLRIGFEPSIGQVLGLSTDSLSAQWRRKVEQQYVPLMTGRAAPDELGKVIISPDLDGGQQNLSPSLSPDGRYIAFLSEKDLFSIDLYLADAETGEIVRKLTSAASDPHVDALRYVESSGTWSPDGQYFAYVVFADGDNQIVIVETEDGDTWKKIHPQGIGAINNPAWSPDGRKIAFTGMVGGLSDLYTYDLESGELEQLTNDKHGDFHPEWSPDGTTIAFTSDRGPETDFRTLVYSKYRISLLDVATREVEVLDIFGNVRHTNPQFSPDGRTLYFLSDQDGFADIYRIRLASGAVERVTRIVSGISGVTSMSPALTVADRSGDLAFSVFNDGYNIHTLPAEAAAERVTVAVSDADIRGRNLPPATPAQFSRVAEYLDDPATGLPPEGTYSAAEAEEYDASLALDFIGQPSLGVGADRFGNYIGGGASAFFSDMLGNKILGVAIQAQGTVKDIGGAVQYADLGDRWNWGVSAARIPYLLYGFRTVENSEDSTPGAGFFGQIRQRIYITSASGTVAYPFSTTRRMEFSAGAVRYSYDLEEDRFIFDPAGRIIDFDRVDVDQSCADAEPGTLCEREPINLAQASAAWVGDNAFFGFVSPVRGKRFRYELQQTVGTETFTQAVADFRRYFQPHRNLTVAARGLHIGRYGTDLEDNDQFSRVRTSILQPMFLGYETFIRGYAYESFETAECRASVEDAARDLQTAAFSDQCPAFSRLLGHKLAVANFELRVPLLGVERYGLIEFPFLPTELVVFQDAGLAWTDFDDRFQFQNAQGGVSSVGTELSFEESSWRPVPVFSTGVGARFNVLGFMIVEAYYAKPWQRPFKGGHWGFQIAPGW